MWYFHNLQQFLTFLYFILYLFRYLFSASIIQSAVSTFSQRSTGLWLYLYNIYLPESPYINIKFTTFFDIQQSIQTPKMSNIAIRSRHFCIGTLVEVLFGQVTFIILTLIFGKKYLYLKNVDIIKMKLLAKRWIFLSLRRQYK